MTKKIASTPEAWEEGVLGNDESYAKVSAQAQSEIDSALELQLISIRLQKSLIDKFKIIALKNGIGYQPLMKQVLTRFADAEMNLIMNEMIAKENNKSSHVAKKSTTKIKKQA